MGDFRVRGRTASIALVILTAAVFGSIYAARGQAPSFYGFPRDWSHGHLIFSNPGTLADAVRNNAVARWFEIGGEIRFGYQQAGRNPGSMRIFRLDPIRPQPVRPPAPIDNQNGGIEGDWAMLPASAAKGTAAVYPAKFGFSATTASCSDFAVYPTSVAGSASKPSIVGYTNLYTGCGGSVPNVLFSVNLNAGTVVTSPVLSIDGSQVAFVATLGSAANLVVLNIPSSASTSPVTSITSASSTVNSATPCTAPCATWIAFSGNNADTTSSPFYDYSANVLYVGDSKGVLHKFQNVFSHLLGGGTNNTAPTEVTSAPWPVTVSSGNALTSPVYDSGTSKRIFLGTGKGNTLAGVSISGSTATVTATAVIATGGVGASTDPIVDSTAQTVYLGVSHGNATTTSTGDTKQPFVYQFAASFAASALPGGAVAISPAATDQSDGQVVYGVAFDNIYLSSANQTGNIYACGLNASKRPELYRIAISANVLGSATAGPVLSGNGATCSPITEFSNGGTDRIFVGQTGTNVTASPISCAAGTGCLMSFDVTSGTQTFSATTPTTSATAAEASGVSGIIVDNAVSTPTGASQVYFSVLGSRTCVRTITGNDTMMSANLTATSGIFTAGDVGAAISGTGIPPMAKISTVSSSTAASLSMNAMSTNSGTTFTITATGGCAIQASQSSLN